MNYNTILPPFKWFVLQNFPYIEEDFDALTNWQLFCKLGKEMNKIIEKTNLTGEQVENLTNAFNALKEYVDDYFENLDVQDEINNKLDEMVKDGTLEDIISQYITSNVTRTYETIDDAITDASNLSNGMKIKTLGYYEIDDGGACEYLITDTADENELQIELTDGLYAQLIYNNTIYVKQYGCYCDDDHDDTIKLQEILDFATNKVGFYGTDGIIVDGLNQPMKVTATLKYGFEIKLQNLHVNFYDGTYTQNYAIIINANDNLAIINNYPRENVGYTKYCRFSNKSQLALNGIYHATNNLYSDIAMDHFDTFFTTSADYLDSWFIDRFHLTDKLESNNYGVICGNIGDNCGIKNSHFNFNGKGITIGSAHNGFIIENLICHADIIAGRSNVSINNLHMENGSLSFNETTLKLTNAMIWKMTSNTISLTKCEAIFENIIFIYRQDVLSYEDVNDIDIYADDLSNYEVKNCYKKVLEPNNDVPLYTYNKSHIKTNRDNAPTVSSYKRYNTVLNTHSKTVAPQTRWGFGTERQFGKWFGPETSYFFKALIMVDYDRLVANLTYNKVFNFSFTTAGWGALVSSTNVGYRIYRGTENGVYDSYCDIAHNNGYLIDNGFVINGNKWQSRTPGGIDNMNQVVLDTITKYDENDNITVYLNALPTYGTWKQGDKVIVSGTVYLCTVGGTPGTWVQV